MYSAISAVLLCTVLYAQHPTKVKVQSSFEPSAERIERNDSIKAMLSRQTDISSLEINRTLWHNFDWTEDVLASQKGYTLLGHLPHKHSRQIKKCPVGIGYETLDRDTFDPASTYEFLGECGVKMARCQTGWFKCEKVAGKYDFAWLDDVVDGLAQQSIQTWFSLSFGHSLYTPNDQFSSQWEQARRDSTIVPGWGRGWVGELPCYHGDKAMKAWLKYVTALAQHFKGRVSIFEIWNEPEWFGRVNGVRASDIYGDMEAARRFTEFVRATREAVLKVIPEAQFTINFASITAMWPMATAQAGLPDLLDFVCYHDYNRSPEEHMDEALKYLKAWYRKSDGTPLPIWQGESGRATGPSEENTKSATEYSQAKYVARRILFDLGHGAQKTSIFTVTDFLAYYPDGRDQYYGIWSARENRPKHAYYTLQWLCGLLDGAQLQEKNFACFSTSTTKTAMSLLDYAAVEVVPLEREGVPMFAIWQKEAVDMSALPLKGMLKYITGPVSRIPHPIIIDPIRGKVYDAQASRGYYSCGAETMTMWAVDYPLILTDISIFDDYLGL